MNPIIFKTVKRQKLYLSTTGKWIKTKLLARTFANTEEARKEADKHEASVTYYTFRD